MLWVVNDKLDSVPCEQVETSLLFGAMFNLYIGAYLYKSAKSLIRGVVVRCSLSLSLSLCFVSLAVYVIVFYAEK